MGKVRMWWLRLWATETEKSYVNNDSSYIAKLDKLASFEGQPVEAVLVKHFEGWKNVKHYLIAGHGEHKLEARYSKARPEDGLQTGMAMCFGLYRKAKLVTGLPNAGGWRQQFYCIITDEGLIRSRADIERFLTKKYGKVWKTAVSTGQTLRSSSTPSTP